MQVRALVRTRSCVRAWVRAVMRTCKNACMRARMRAHVQYSTTDTFIIEYITAATHCRVNFLVRILRFQKSRARKLSLENYAYSFFLHFEAN